MRELEERIIKEGKVLDNEIIKVGSFLNHQVDISLLKKMAIETKRLFATDSSKVITKVLTIESSGIPFATALAMEYNVPLVFAKKEKTLNLSGELISSSVYSYTHKELNQIYIPREYINENDVVLIADDFLANGEALNGLIDIVTKCGATIFGCVVQIEKTYQNGGNKLRGKGYKVIALASIKEIITNKILFN